MERWRPVPSYEGHYEVSDHGRVRRVSGACGTRSGFVLKGDLSARYPRVRLSVENRQEMLSVHRLVLRAFCGEPPIGRQECNHIDGDPKNNRLENLEWVSRSENARHAYENGLQVGKGQKGEEHPRSKLTDDLVVMLREMKSLGMSGTKMAKALGMNPKSVNNAIRGVTWSHVEGGLS